MCGIVGILGRQPAAGLLLDALKRLEYRGYDSAGMATLVDGRIERRRAEGKLANLERVLEQEALPGVVGIGHTRWATHGAPTRDNAHPHQAGGVAVVHNGIIENFQVLRDELIGHGDGEMYLGSDALALAPLTDRIQYLEEGDWAVLNPRGAAVYGADGQPVVREIKQTALSGALIGKGNYRHFMHKEIHEQPAVIGDTLRTFASPIDHRISLPELPVDF